MRFPRVWAVAWLCIVCWFLTFGFILSPVFGNDERLRDVLPEPESLVAAVLMGWLPAGVIATVAMIAARLIGGRQIVPAVYLD